MLKWLLLGLLLSAQAGLVSGYDHGGSHSYVIIIVVVVVVKVIFWVAVCHACGQRRDSNGTDCVQRTAYHIPHTPGRARNAGLYPTQYNPRTTIINNDWNAQPEVHI